MLNLSITKYSLSIFFIRYFLPIFIRLFWLRIPWGPNNIPRFTKCIQNLFMLPSIITTKIKTRREPLSSVIISFHTSPPFYWVKSSCFVPKIQSKILWWCYIYILCSNICILLSGHLISKKSRIYILHSTLRSSQFIIQFTFCSQYQIL